MIIDLEKENMGIQEALFIAKPNDIIMLANKTYNEKVIVETPYLTFIGKDNTKIALESYAGLKDKNSNKNIGTTGSSIFRVLENAHHCNFINITFENTHIRTCKIEAEQAVAFKTSASFTKIKNCKFISFQDTLYIDQGIMNLVKDSYVEGDVDFVFGSADCVFLNTTLSSKRVGEGSYYTAPSTLAQNRRGFVFKNCTFNQLFDHESYIGRPWYPSSGQRPALPKLNIIDSKLIGNIKTEFKKMRINDPNYHNVSYYNSTLNGNMLNNDNIDYNSYINDVLKYHNEC